MFIRIQLILLSALLYSCSAFEDNTMNIEGVYVANAESEFSMAMDTVTIMLHNQTAGTFLIIHRKGFHRIKDGVFGKKELKEERLVAVWKESAGLLQEQKFGRTYSFSSSGSDLLLGSVRYRRLD